MPKFNYAAARAAGFSDEQIAASLAKRRAAGDSVWVDRAEADSVRGGAPQGAFQAAPADASGQGSGTAGGSGGAIDATAGALGRALEYPANLLFQELPERFDRAVGGFIGTPGLPDIHQVASATARAARAAWLNRGPTAAEQLAKFQNRGVGEGYLGQGLEAAVNAVTSSGIGSVANFASSPAGQGLALNLVASELLNPVGAVAGAGLKAVGMSRAANRARGLPGVSQVGDFFSRGFSVTDPTQRAALRASIEQRLGEEALQNARLAEETALRSDMLKRITDRTSEGPIAVQERIRTALEEVPRTGGQSFRGLASDERRLASSLSQQTRRAPEARVAEGLDPWVLNSDLEQRITVAERRAAKAVSARKFAEEHAAMWYGAPRRSVGKAMSMAKREEAKLTKSVHAFEDVSGLSAPRTPSRRLDFPKIPAWIKSTRGEFVAYEPRVGTEALRKALKESGGGEPIVYGGPRGLSTSTGPMRTSDPRITTTQQELKLANELKLGNESAFRPSIEASLLKGQHGARQLANARIVKDAVRYAGRTMTGKNVTPGYRKLSDIQAAKSGFNNIQTKVLEKTEVPEAVFNALEDYSKAVATQKGLPVLGSFNRYFKTSATSINPRFTIRNAEWNGVIGFVRGNRDPRNFADASTALARTNDLAPVKGIKVRFGKLRDELISNRVVGTGFATEGLPGKALSDASRANKILGAVPRAMGKANQQQEDIFRAAYYIAKRRAGMSAKEAAADVRHTYFNYNRDAFTAGEGAIRRNLIPFYSWQRRILPLTLRSLGETPSMFPQIGTTISTVNLWNGMSPDEVQYLGPDMLQAIGVALPAYTGQKLGERRVLSLSALGMTGDINAMVGTRGRGASGQIENILSSMTPAIGKPLGLATRRDFFRGRVLDGSTVELPAYLKPLILAAPKFAERLSLRIENGRVIGTDFTREILTIPGQFPSAMADLQAASIGDKNALRRALAWATSVNTSVRDIGTGKDITESKEVGKEKETYRMERKSGYLQERFQREDELNQRIGGQE